jgi:conjugal transfer/entry exclusion protein
MDHNSAQNDIMIYKNSIGNTFSTPTKAIAQLQHNV